MKIRIIDYQANPGGGVRFTTELLRALLQVAPFVRPEFVSYGQALQHYANVFRREGLEVPCLAIAPKGYWRTLPATRVLGIPGTGWVKRMLGYDSRWYYDVSATALANCDVAWFPWLHRHRLPDKDGRRVVGSFHDAIVFVWPDLVAPRQLRDEQRTLNGWITSGARILVSSSATLGVLADALHIPPTRFILARVGWTHVELARPSTAPVDKPWARDRYLLCPANTSPHKNHEVLFAALARWGAAVPVVLTGYGTDLPPGDARAGVLRWLAASEGLVIGKSIVPLGYVPDETYYSLLAHAWALVMPSRLEGGGSFPVMEAVLSGVPVVCSDIPVLREQMEDVGGRVLWFNPADPADLAARLDDLDRHYTAWLAEARTQVGRLRLRTWRQAAEEYAQVLSQAAGGNG